MDSSEPSNGFEIEAVKWVQKGFALAYHDNHPVFLHGAIPGETVLARPVLQNRNHTIAITEQIVHSSDRRIKSDCSHFPQCGGCSFRHVSYEEERSIKLALLHELKYLPTELLVEENYVFAERNGYRNHVRIQSENGRHGFFSLHSHDIIEWNGVGCRNLSDEMNRVILNYDNFPEKGESRFRENGGSVCTPDMLRTTPLLKERLEKNGSFEWLFPSDGFFQTNRHLLPVWLESIRSMIPDHRPDTVELFAGSALLGGYGRKKINRYTGYESDPSAIAAARQNFQNHGFDGEFFVTDLYRTAPDLDGIELLLVNPPRGGLNRKLLYAITEGAPETILYSSCNPQTLNRDLAFLYGGGYRSVLLKFFDFFPGTFHGELVVKLERSSRHSAEKMTKRGNG